MHSLQDFLMASAGFDAFLNDLLLRCFWESCPAYTFVQELSDGMTRYSVPVTELLSICTTILRLGSERLADSSQLTFDYVEFMHISKCIDDELYVKCLASFNAFERFNDVPILIDRLKSIILGLSCAYMDVDECIASCQAAFSVLRVMVVALCTSVDITARIIDESAVLVELKSMDDEDPSETDDSTDVDEEAVKATHSILDGIAFLLDDVFSQLMIHFCYSLNTKQNIANEFTEMTNKVRNRCKFLISKLEQNSQKEFLKKCAQSAQCVLQDFHKFEKLPSLEWKYFRDDFICREFRPTILTLGSIFATFRVLKSNEEIAESFLVVGDSLGMSRPQIIFDILRSGFLIQLETATNARPEQSVREPMADTYVFLRIPLIFARLIDAGVTHSDIFDALTRMSHCSTLLNELDSKLFDNSFQFVIDKLKDLKVLDDNQLAQLSDNRKRGIERNPSLMELLQDNGASRQKSRIQILVVAQRAKKVFGMEVWTEMEKKIEKLMQNVSYIDLICAVCCADEDLPVFTSNLASINYQTQNSSNATPIANRMYIFDSTFILLSRIAMVWEDLRLEDLVGDNVNGAFYNWMKRYMHCHDMSEPMPVDLHLKQNFLTQFNILKSPTPFWNETWDFAALIDHVPLIGDIILDEFRNEHCNESEIHNLLATFRQMACMLLCLVQWLETQPASPAKHAFLKTLRNFGNTRGQEPADKLLYTILVERKCSKLVVEGRRQREQPYTWVINFAQRQLPNITQYLDEAPDLQMLKEAFLYSNQQGWANPDVIALINRCNRDVKHREWCTCWMKQMLKAWTSDEMDVASELCLAAALTSPVPCLLEIVHRLVDFVLYSSSTSLSVSRGKVSLETFSNTSSSIAASQSSQISSSSSFHHSSNYVNVEFHKASANELAKMLVRTLVLLIWAEDRRKMDRRRRAQRNASRKRKLEEDAAKSISDLTLKSEKQIKYEVPDDEESCGATQMSFTTSEGSKDAVLETILKVFERFDGMIRGACLKPAVTFVIFFIHELAKAPKTPYRQRLIDLIPINMMFSLVRLDAAALPLSMFLKLYDIKNEKNRIRCLKYTCMMRKFGLI